MVTSDINNLILGKYISAGKKMVLSFNRKLLVSQSDFLAKKILEKHVCLCSPKVLNHCNKHSSVREEPY